MDADLLKRIADDNQRFAVIRLDYDAQEDCDCDETGMCSSHIAQHALALIEGLLRRGGVPHV